MKRNRPTIAIGIQYVCMVQGQAGNSGTSLDQKLFVFYCADSLRTCVHTNISLFVKSDKLA